MQVYQNVHFRPIRTSLISHTYLSSSKERGIQAKIFIETPKDEKYREVQSNSVYLTTCDKNRTFEDFEVASQTAVILTIPLYISILSFFQKNWPEIKKHCLLNFSRIQKEVIPFQITPYIHYTLAAACKYETKIEDAQLIFERSTEEPDLPNQFLLERNGRTVLLDADTMHSFAAGTVQDLVDHLYKAGYVDLCSQSDHA
jgi:hypothetical protein